MLGGVTLLTHPLVRRKFASPVPPRHRLAGRPGVGLDAGRGACRGDVRRLALVDDLGELDARVSVCSACPRLVAWREQVAEAKRASFADQPYWGRPIAGWGDERPAVLIVGLAPAANGGNWTAGCSPATGRGTGCSPSNLEALPPSASAWSYSATMNRAAAAATGSSSGQHPPGLRQLRQHPRHMIFGLMALPDKESRPSSSSAVFTSLMLFRRRSGSLRRQRLMIPSRFPCSSSGIDGFFGSSRKIAERVDTMVSL